MVTGGRCKRYCLKWKPTEKGSYLKGHKWCKSCCGNENDRRIFTGWIVTDKYVCPCCGYTLRSKPRGSTYYRNKVVMVKTNGKGYKRY